jgi:hypothetical protein
MSTAVGTREAGAGPLSSAGALGLGVGFSLLYCAGIWWVSGALAGVPHLPDRGASWYYWVLPEGTWGGFLSAWGLYLAHQLANFALIFHAQTRVRRYTRGLHPVNVVALVVNAVFVLLHLAQTHVFYDGLAQTVNVFSSLGSVAILLIWVLLMENPNRGLFFGYPVPLSRRVTGAARKYHGYYFSWAIVFTFWFHPTEATQGHLIGFFYLLLIMLQGCLFLTTAHLNRAWRMLLEVLVLVHGTTVAVMQGQGLWPMFCFGFGAIFVITQLHGLGWSRLARALVLAVYGAAVLAIYAERGFVRLEEVARIPVIDYLGVLLLAGLIGLALRVIDRVQRRSIPSGVGAGTAEG